MTVQWIDIPIPVQPTIKWVRYHVLRGSTVCLLGYVPSLASSHAQCIVPKTDASRDREAFAVLRHLWGVKTPLLYSGPPSRQEMDVLNGFIACKCAQRTAP